MAVVVAVCGNIQADEAQIPETSIVVFAGFGDTPSARVAGVLRQLRDSPEHRLNARFKHRPSRAGFEILHGAAVAAEQQNRLWQMLDHLYITPPTRAAVVALARTHGLDVDAFASFLDSGAYKARIEADELEARAMGVTDSPTIFINGMKFAGPESGPLLKAAAYKLPAEAVLDPVRVDAGESPVKGPTNAPVTVVVFSDFECPFCARLVSPLDMTTRAFPGKVRVVYKHFPLTFHKNAMLAHAAAAAAHAQGKFWELHDRIFEERKVGREDLIRMARVSGVDVDRFILDMDGGKYTTSIQADRAAGEAAGVVATPTILINGKKYEGAKTADELVALVGREIAATVPDAQPVAESTSATYYRGEADAPITIESFLDMQSSLLGRAKELLEQVEHGFRGQVKVVVRHRPLPGRDLSFAAHEALLAAGAQGKFWQYLELLAERNGAIGEADLVAFAVKLELDQLRFRRDLDQHTFRPDVQRDLEMARKADIRGTPTFLIDGKRIDGLQPMTIFDGLIQGAIRSKEDKAR